LSPYFLPFFQEITVEMGLLGVVDATVSTDVDWPSRERADTLLITQASTHTPARSSRHVRVLHMVVLVMIMLGVVPVG
jgi:hypothetical protein